MAANRIGNPNKAGRKKGIPNKPKRIMEERAQALGCDPFEILLLFAKGDWEALGYDSKERVASITDNGVIMEYTISPQLRQKSAKDAADFIYPKLRAIEVSDSEGKDVFKTFAELVAGIAESSDGQDDEK